MRRQERYHDECALCHADIWTHSIGPMGESFCATCRIAHALEQLVEIIDEHTEVNS
jgi:hypothetical protein